MYIEVCRATVIFGRDRAENCAHLSQTQALSLNEGSSRCRYQRAVGAVLAAGRDMSPRGASFPLPPSSFLPVTARGTVASPRWARPGLPPLLSADPRDRRGTEAEGDAAVGPASWRRCASSGGVRGPAVRFQLSRFFALSLISFILLVENRTKATTALNQVCALSEFSVLQMLSL